MSRHSSTMKSSTDLFDYHPDYGLPNNVRLHAVYESYALCPKRAAVNNNVGLSTIYRWRKDCGIEIKPEHI